MVLLITITGISLILPSKAYNWTKCKLPPSDLSTLVDQRQPHLAIYLLCKVTLHQLGECDPSQMWMMSSESTCRIERHSNSSPVSWVCSLNSLLISRTPASRSGRKQLRTSSHRTRSTSSSSTEYEDTRSNHIHLKLISDSGTFQKSNYNGKLT